MKTIIWLCCVAAVALLSGCGAKKFSSPDEYAAEADKLYRDRAYGIAIERYRELLDQYPFSDHTEDAELRVAHAYFLQGDYVEAIVALTDFQRRHPTSPHLPFVGYHLGMCYKLQMDSIDRDQSAAKSAETYFATVVHQYPASPYAQLARQQLAECRNSLAGHELYVADFYARRGNGAAAERRAIEVVGRYPDSDPAPEALARLGRWYEEQDDEQRAALAYASLAQQYPQSDHADAAREAVQRLDRPAEEAPLDPRRTLLVVSGYAPAGQTVSEPVDVPGIEPSADRRPTSAGIPPASGPPGATSRNAPY